MSESQSPPRDDIAHRLTSADEAPGLPPDLSEDQTLLVSIKVLRGSPVLFGYRDLPEAGDSGWTLLAGDEPDAWLEDPDRFEERTVSWILDRDPTLLAILGLPPDTSVEREEVGGEWAELEEDNEG